MLLFQQRSPGKVLFDLVCVHLNLAEGDYFGLEYQDQRKMTVRHSVLLFRQSRDTGRVELVSDCLFKGCYKPLEMFHIIQAEWHKIDKLNDTNQI